MSNGTELDYGTCEWRSPGKNTEHPATKYMSGSAICTECWYWVKLDGPAHRHWSKVTDEFLSNVDFHDISSFLPKVFGDDGTKGRQLLELANEFRKALKRMEDGE
jgi:hypothetical protein